MQSHLACTLLTSRPSSLSLYLPHRHIYIHACSERTLETVILYFILLSVCVSVFVFYPTLPHPPLPHPDLISDHVAPPAGQQRGNSLFTGTRCPCTRTDDYFAVLRKQV